MLPVVLSGGSKNSLHTSLRNTLKWESSRARVDRESGHHRWGRVGAASLVAQRREPGPRL